MIENQNSEGSNKIHPADMKQNIQMASGQQQQQEQSPKSDWKKNTTAATTAIILE